MIKLINFIHFIPFYTKITDVNMDSNEKRKKSLPATAKTQTVRVLSRSPLEGAVKSLEGAAGELKQEFSARNTLVLSVDVEVVNNLDLEYARNKDIPLH